MRQLITDLRTGRPVRTALKGWWDRESRGILVGVVVALLGYGGYEQVQIRGINGRQCQDIQVVARITGDTVATQIRNSRVILPKIRFPGLTRHELLALTAAKEAQERRHQTELERVARSSCQ